MRKLVVLLMIVIMTGCGSYDTRSYEGLKKTEPAVSRLGAVVYLIHKGALPSGEKSGGKKCFSEFDPNEVREILHPPEKGAENFVPALVAVPLIAAGVAFAATFVVDSINTAIEEYKKGLSGSFVAAGISKIELSKVVCIAIGRGLLTKPVKDSTNLYHQLGFKDNPAFYLELKVDESTGDKPTEKTQTASSPAVPQGDANPGTTGKKETRSVTLTPFYLSYADSAAKTAGSGKKHVGVAIAFSDTAQKKPEEIDEEKAFAVFRHDLGRLEIGMSYDKDLLKGTGASASLTEEAYLKNTFNLSAIISDGEDPGIALEVLSKTFTDKKADLKKALEEAITNAINKTKPTKKEGAGVGNYD